MKCLTARPDRGAILPSEMTPVSARARSDGQEEEEEEEKEQGQEPN